MERCSIILQICCTCMNLVVGFEADVSFCVGILARFSASALKSFPAFVSDATFTWAEVQTFTWPFRNLNRFLVTWPEIISAFARWQIPACAFSVLLLWFQTSSWSSQYLQGLRKLKKQGSRIKMPSLLCLIELVKCRVSEVKVSLLLELNCSLYLKKKCCNYWSKICQTIVTMCF